MAFIPEYSGNVASAFANVTAALPLGDGSFNTPQSTVSSSSIIRRFAGTFSTLVVEVPTNTRVISVTFDIPVNGTAGAVTLSVPASTTGEFKSPSNAGIHFNSGDTTYLRASASGTVGGALNAGSIAVQCGTDAMSTTIKKFCLGGQVGGSNFSTASSSAYLRLCGDISAGTSTYVTTQSFQTAALYNNNATLKNLYVNVTGNARSTTTTLGTIANNVTGNLIISVSASSTGIFEDTTHSDTISSGGLACYYITTGSGTGNFATSLWGVELQTTDNSTTVISNGLNNAITIAKNLTVYMAYGAGRGPTATESFASAPVQTAGTIDKMSVNVVANTVTAASTVTSRKNLANGNLSVSITASTTGVFSDTTHSDSVIATDTMDFKIVTGATGTSLSINTIATRFTRTLSANSGNPGVPGDLLMMLGSGA